MTCAWLSVPHPQHHVHLPFLRRRPHCHIPLQIYIHTERYIECWRPSSKPWNFPFGCAHLIRVCQGMERVSPAEAHALRKYLDTHTARKVPATRRQIANTNHRQNKNTEELFGVLTLLHTVFHTECSQPHPIPPPLASGVCKCCVMNKMNELSHTNSF